MKNITRNLQISQVLDHIPLLSLHQLPLKFLPCLLLPLRKDNAPSRVLGLDGEPVLFLQVGLDFLQDFSC